MQNLLKSLFTPIVMPHWAMDFLLAIPRIIGCFLLATRFGMSKFPTPQWFVDDITKLGLPFPFLLAWAAVLTEVVGGFCLSMGLMTRIWGGLLTITMLVAIFFQKWNSDLWEKLPAMGFLWLAIFALVLGSGRFGLDYWLAKKWK